MQDKFYAFYKSRIENMDFELLKSRINDRKVYIWGADHKGIWLRNVLIQNNILVKGLIDSNIEIVDENFDDEYDNDTLNSDEKFSSIISILLDCKIFEILLFTDSSFSFLLLCFSVRLSSGDDSIPRNSS